MKYHQQQQPAVCKQQQQKMTFPEYVKQRILALSRDGLRPPTIARILAQKGVKASRQGIDKFLLRYEEDRSTSRRKGSGRPTIITEGMREIVEERMQADDKTTVRQLHCCLTEEHGYSSCKRTAFRCRTGLGWTHRGSAHCQLMTKHKPR